MLWHNSIITVKKDEVDMNSNSSLFRGKLLITLSFTIMKIKLFLLQLPLNTDCL